MPRPMLIFAAAGLLALGAACAAVEEEPLTEPGPTTFSLTGEVSEVDVDEGVFEDERTFTMVVSPRGLDDVEGLLECPADVDGDYTIEVDTDDVTVPGEPQDLEGQTVEVEGDIDRDVIGGECTLNATSIRTVPEGPGTAPAVPGPGDATPAPDATPTPTPDEATPTPTPTPTP